MEILLLVFFLNQKDQPRANWTTLGRRNPKRQDRDWTYLWGTNVNKNLQWESRMYIVKDIKKKKSIKLEIMSKPVIICQGGTLKGSLGLEGWEGKTGNSGERKKMETMWEFSNTEIDFGGKFCIADKDCPSTLFFCECRYMTTPLNDLLSNRSTHVEKAWLHKNALTDVIQERNNNVPRNNCEEPLYSC